MVYDVTAKGYVDSVKQCLLEVDVGEGIIHLYTSIYIRDGVTWLYR